jgi:signal transduction histidine kinase
VAGGAIATGVVDGLALSTAVDAPAGGDYTSYQGAIADALTHRAHELNTAATSRQRWFAAMAALVLVSATAVAWVVSRSITRPLRSLTRHAADVADRGLPEAVASILTAPLGENVVVPQVTSVQIDSSDEVSDLADAINTVQHAALDLAVEQAVLRRNIADSFVNLGRRNQNLLGRQLDFITELETNETDAGVLADLFQLDHLATRMRRNAESLLVLAGTEPSRQGAAPARLTDVVRAALGEVEDYQRVALRDIEQATVLGFAAADLAHLLAELIENALVFSSPDRTVDIHGRYRADRQPGAQDATHYVLAIVDAGLGMPTAELASANRRLAGTETFTVAPSKYLGHYVAGKLAARHGIRIHLDSPLANGVTATVWLPLTLLAADARRAPFMPPLPGARVHGTWTSQHSARLARYRPSRSARHLER